MTPSDVLVVVPAYNESAHIGPVVRRVLQLGYSVLVSDDASKDDTVKVAREAGARVLEAPKNGGKGAAMKRGIEWFLRDGASRRPAIVFMDADGQHDPDDLASFLEELGRGRYSLILGDRMGRPVGMPLIRRLTNRFMSWLISRLAGQRIPDTQCGYRAMTRELAKALRLGTDRFEIETEMLLETARLGHKIGSLPARCVYADEKSQVNPLRDTYRFLKFLTDYLGRRASRSAS